MNPEALHRTAGINVYPSQKCTYTLDKKRIFVRVRDEHGNKLKDCAVFHILLHELAHTVNDGVGHNPGFYQWLKWLERGVPQCPGHIPAGFNPCH